MANIIFDFDGTIADSFALAVHIFEQVARNGERFPAGEVKRLQSMSLVHLLIELRIRPWQAPLLMTKGRTQMRQQIDQVKVFDGMPELIRSLFADGHQLYIVSSNSVQNIRTVLKKHDLDKDFIKVYGGAGLLGKAHLLKGVLRLRKLQRAETIYIGDEVRDIEAAKRAGLRVISVTWGYNNESVLREHHPDFVATNSTDIIDIINAK